jgi:hypothetical protein
MQGEQRTDSKRSDTDGDGGGRGGAGRGMRGEGGGQEAHRQRARDAWCTARANAGSIRMLSGTPAQLSEEDAALVLCR